MTSKSSLKVYEYLARWRFPRSYLGKILFVAFVGTHVPLLTLLLAFVVEHSLSRGEAGRTLLIALFATLAGTGATLWTLIRLLAPVTLTQQSLRNYLQDASLPDLPTRYGDQAGVLMADTQNTIRRMDDLIQSLKNRDRLTSLPNREAFADITRQTLAESEKNGGSPGMMVLDLKGFHGINDLLGQKSGDDVLRRVAARLQTAVADSGHLARLGGDEFVILQSNAGSPERAERLARTVLDTIGSRPFRFGSQTVSLSARLGISLLAAPSAPGVSTNAAPQSPDIKAGNESGSALLRDAEAALYQAKRQDIPYLFYSSELNREILERAQFASDLQRALSLDEMTLHYQPQIDLAAGRVIGVEALIRWRRDGKDLIAPGSFLPIAEESDLILSIGEWALREACRQVRQWQKAGLPPVRMAVNLSARQMAESDLPRIVASALLDTGLEASLLELEITESIAMQDLHHSVRMMKELRGMGVGMALDDFGTGYSSLAYLQRFPLDAVKLDRSFVQDICHSRSDAAIADAVINLAHSLHLRAVAEGVETIEQRDRLHQAGCDMLQGYLFSRPVPADEVERVLSSKLSLPTFQSGDPTIGFSSGRMAAVS